MNINTGLNHYNSNFINNVTDRGKMSQSQSLTGSVTDSLKEGEVFEGSVNSIENGKVTIGLANGQTMTARLDAGVSLTPGQSVFFEVKSNDGSLVQIRPVSLNSLEANPTLLKALDMANLAVNERTINMVNSMMQNSMSVSPENLAAMNRAMINNPEVDIQTLVTMQKHGMELSSDNVNMFQNYASDKAVLSDNFETISEMLPELMTSEELSSADVININNAIKDIFITAKEAAASAGEIPVAETVNEEGIIADNSKEGVVVQNNSQNLGEANVAVKPGDVNVIADLALTEGQTNETAATKEATTINNPLPEDVELLNNNQAVKDSQINADAGKTAENAENAPVREFELGNNQLSQIANEKQINSFNNILNNLSDFPKDNPALFTENGTLRADADINQLFKELSNYLNEHPEMSKDMLNSIIKEPLYRGLLKNVIANSFALDPKDVTKPGEISKLYEKVLKQTESLEKLIASFNNKAAETIKNQTNEIRQNINFMNSANEMYNFVQIPLKMYNQNTDSMLYVKQNKRSSYEAGEEITAFLHFDMEHLGSTDVFISLKEANVNCNWNLESEESMKLIEDNLDLLTERLAAKGFSVSSQVTCGNPKASFVEDFLGEVPVGTDNKSDGLVHRYSFDMRA